MLSSSNIIALIKGLNQLLVSSPWCALKQQLLALAKGWEMVTSGLDNYRHAAGLGHGLQLQNGLEMDKLLYI